MTSTRRTRSASFLFLGLIVGGSAGYLIAQSRAQRSAANTGSYDAALAQIRTELAEVKAMVAPDARDQRLEELHGIVTEILLRGDEFSLRADFARNADRLDGRRAADFALRDADGDGKDDLDQLRHSLEEIVSGDTPVAKAKKADSAGNAEFFGSLPIADFAPADHSHPTLLGDVSLADNVRIGGTLAVASNTIASGDVQVFGEVVAVGGLLPGSVEVDPKPAIAGMIRYNRRTGALEYCDGTRWHEVAVVQEQ